MKKRLAMVLLGAALAACSDDSSTELSDDLITCGFGSAQTLPLGGVLNNAGGRAAFCIEAADGGSYVLVPFVAGARDTIARVTVRVFGGGLSSVPPTLDGSLSRVSLRPEASVASMIEATDEFDHSLRLRENASLPASIAVQQRPALRSNAADVPSAGDVLQINVSTECARLDLRSARVAYVSNKAIVAFDPANPANDTFTDDDWRNFGDRFDQLIYPTLRENFGAETDIDGNGRTILYFTRAVNALGVPGSVGIVGGFFWRGDLFPRAGVPGRTAPCAGSNEAEILFFAAPDPEGEVRGVPITARTLREVIVATIGHEFQHLVNSGQRLYTTNAPVLEDVWLNEGLSYIAEELIFYAAAGVGPGQNLDVAAVTTTQQRRDAFSQFAVGNLGRFNVFLLAPQDWSAIGRDAIATRGAAWSFLRYVADRDPRPDATLWRALITGQAAGMQNLANALGRDPLPWMQDWTVSVFADDFVAGLDARYQQPSWAMRELIAALRIDSRYPLRVLPMQPGEGFSVRLQPGSAAYPVFTLTPGSRAIIVLEPDGETSDRTIRTALIRVQ